MKTIGIDPGNTWAWAFACNGKCEKTAAEKFESLAVLEAQFVELLHTWSPEAVVSCRAFGRSQVVIRKHSAIAAVIELACQKRRIAYFELSDTTLRKHVHGHARIAKEEVRRIIGTATDHESDAATAAIYGSRFLRRI